MTTLEKAARAACAADGEDWDEIHETPAEGIPCRSNYLAMTAAALTSVLLDPSDEVVEAALNAPFDDLTGPRFDANGPTRSFMRAALRAVGMKITGRE